MNKNREGRGRGELLTEQEALRFIHLRKKNKVKGREIAQKVGVKSGQVVSAWGKNVPARCRALLELWELREKIKEINND